jgi:hypothetical protein
MSNYTKTKENHRLDGSIGGYVDIRRIHPDREFRTCAVCGHEWLHKYWSGEEGRKDAAETSNCPNCRLAPLLDVLSRTYATDLLVAEPDDPGIRPSPTLRYVGRAMAHEASEFVGYEVNSLSCELYIRYHIPGWHWLGRDEHPTEGFDRGRISDEYRDDGDRA